MEQKERLPNIILFNLNPCDNAALASLTGSFAEDDMPGKIQFGPAWWYNDHQTGICNTWSSIANHSLLSCFIGMTTDSRSLLSMTHHEYFRRLLCNWIGKQVKTGNFPDDNDIVETLVRRIAYENAAQKLQINGEPMNNSFFKKKQQL